MSQEFEHKEAVNEEAELEAGEEVRQEEAPSASEKTEEEQLEECRAKLCAACNVAAEANAVKLRALAEMDNFKKRVQREKEEQARYAAEKVLADLLPTLDNLDLALQYGSQSEESRNMMVGVEMTRTMLLDALKKQKGYRLNEHLLRPARVIVAR